MDYKIEIDKLGIKTFPRPIRFLAGDRITIKYESKSRRGGKMDKKRQDLRTSEEWQKVCKVVVYDPDGWDRGSQEAFRRSWHEEEITREEFERRLGPSTCKFPRDAFTEGFNMWKDLEDGNI